jgi:hypothetical protein
LPRTFAIRIDYDFGYRIRDPHRRAAGCELGEYMSATQSGHELCGGLRVAVHSTAQAGNVSRNQCGDEFGRNACWNAGGKDEQPTSNSHKICGEERHYSFAEFRLSGPAGRDTSAANCGEHRRQLGSAAAANPAQWRERNFHRGRTGNFRPDARIWHALDRASQQGRREL